MERLGKRLTYPIAFATLALLLSFGILTGMWRSEEGSLRARLNSTTQSIAEIAERHFQEHEEFRTAFALESGHLQEQEFAEQAEDFVARHPELQSVVWLTPALDIVFRHPESIPFPGPGGVGSDLLPRSIQGAFHTGRTEAYYSPAVVNETGHPVFYVFRPVFDAQTALVGYLMTATRADVMLDLILPPSIVEGYALDLLLDDGTTHSIRRSGQALDPGLFADVFLKPSRLLLQLTQYDQPGLHHALLLSGLLLLLLIAASGWSMIRIRQAVQARATAEESLRESEERYRALFNNSHTAMLLIDASTGHVEEANPAALKYYGYSIEEIRRKSISEINTLSREEIFAEMEKARAENRSVYRFRHRLASGVIRDVEVFTGPVSVKGRNFLFSIVQDITERTRLQTELDKTLSLQARILENAFVGILYLRQQRVVWANSVAGTLFGESHEKLVGRAPEDFLGSAEEVRHIRKQAAPLLEAGKPFQMEMRVTRKHDDPIWLDIFAKSATPTGLEEGSIWVVRDISSRKLAEQRMQASLAEKEVLLREIHHRVKNNFQVILSLVNLKARRFQDSHVADILHDLASRIRAMSAVHERLYRSPNMAAIDSREYLESIARDVIRTARSGSGIALETRVEAHPLSVETAIPCGIILTELLANVLKHAYPEGQTGIARVRFSRTAATGPNGAGVYCLEVSDTGRGIQDEDRAPRPDSGALGLNLVRSLAEKQLGGSFHVEPGDGTRCLVTFPADPGSARKPKGTEGPARYQEVAP